MKIPRTECPVGFFDRPQDFENSLFVAKIVKWDQVANALGEEKGKVVFNTSL